MTVTQPAAPPEAWQRPPARPPLGAREKSGARLAGIIGFLLLSVGIALFGLPLAVLALGALVAVVVGFLQSATGDPQLGGFARFIEQLDLSAWIIPLIVASIVGLALIAVALVVSARILRAHGVTRPWAVTWAGAGIAVVANWIVSGVLSVPLQFSGVFGDDSGGVAIAIAVLSGLVSLAATAAVGWLSWWWMAHAMRPSVRTP